MIALTGEIGGGSPIYHPGARPISTPIILLIGALAALTAFANRMRWEEVAAFVGGPTFLLLLIQAGNGALKTATIPPPTDAPSPVETTLSTVAAQTPAPTSGNLTEIILLTLATCLGAAFFFVLRATKRPSRSSLLNLWKRLTVFDALKPLWGAKRNTHNGFEVDALYSKTAIQLGALIAASDGRAQPNDFSTLTRVFNLTDANTPTASVLYQQALKNPQRLSLILAPSLAANGKHAPQSEQLIFGLTCIALTDGVMTASELGLINLAAEGLGIPVRQVKRIIMSAGYFGGPSSNAHQKHTSSHTYKPAAAPASELSLHLKTLGLTSDASQRQIRSAWRRLVSEYHPDKLVSQNPSQSELEQAETRMQAVNEAYDWLKEHAG